MSLSVCSSQLTGSAINSTYIIILCKFVFDFLESRHGQTHKYFNIFGRMLNITRLCNAEVMTLHPEFRVRGKWVEVREVH